MRRSEREITSRRDIDEILLRQRVLRLALAVNDEPYVVPLSYGYNPEERVLYLHTATSGRKLEFIARNPRACFEVEGRTTLRPADSACAWGLSYESVIGYGMLTEVLEPDEKADALQCLMRQQTGSALEWDFGPDPLRTTRVWRLAIDSVTGKRAL